MNPVDVAFCDPVAGVAYQVELAGNGDALWLLPSRASGGCHGHRVPSSRPRRARSGLPMFRLQVEKITA